MKKLQSLGVLWISGVASFTIGAAIIVCAVAVPVQSLRFQVGMVGAGMCITGWLLVELSQWLED